MTRLKENDINHIASTLGDYNDDLVRMTGCSLREIAVLASGKNIDFSDQENLLVAVIPMTCGQGIIDGFVQSVASIISFLGFNCVITDYSDAGGVAEAVQMGAEILFMADDDRFLAINIKTGIVADNGEATGKGYVVGLERMCQGLEAKDVLLLGAGPVGSSAAEALVKQGALVTVVDINMSASLRLKDAIEKLGYSIHIETNSEEALAKHHIFVDASPAENVIQRKHISEETKIAAPGIPLGVQGLGADPLLSHIMLHDPLQIGVATMLLSVL